MAKKIDRLRLNALAEQSKNWPAYRHAEVGGAAPEKWEVVRIPDLQQRIRDLEAELAETLEKTDKLVLEAQRGERLAVDKLVDLRRELAEARRDGARYRHIWSASLIHWESGKKHNRISWPTIFAAEPIEGGNYRDRFDAAIDAAMEGK